MKKLVLLVSACGLFGSSAMAQCAANIANTLNSSSARTVGEVWNFHAYDNGGHNPENIVTGGTWTSENPSIASVDATTGVTTAVALGHTKIHWSKPGCSKELSHNVQVNAETTSTTSCELSINIDNITNVSCHGGNTGSIAATVSGASGISYSWSNGATTSDLSEVAAGTYTLTVSKDGCTGASEVVTVNEPAELSATATLGDAILCNGGSTTVTVAATGGTTPYAASTVGIFTKKANIDGYTFTVTDANGCSTSASTGAVTEPSAVNINWAGTVRPNGTYSHTVLFGYDQYMTVSITGGTHGNSSSSATVAVSAMQSTYTVQLNDANGCASNTLTAVGQNVTCGQNGNLTKTSMCKNNKTTICVDNNAVAAQLASGARIGTCGSAWAAKQGQTVSESTEIRLYPNPNNGSFTIEIPAIAQGMDITIIDMNGRVVETRNIAANENAQNVEISLSNISKGIYMVQAIGGEYNFHTKLVIQ